MGAAASDDRGDVEALTLQQQRAQFLLIQQIQEARLLARGENGAPAAMALSSLGLPPLPPVEQPSLLTSEVLQNPAHLRGKTMTLTPGKANEPMILRFSFDTLALCEVTVYRSALLVPAVHCAWQVESAAWSSPPARFPAGLAQTHAVEWDARFGLPQALSQTFESDSDARHCPVLVELRIEGDDKVRPSSVEWTICELLTARGSSGKTRVEVIGQKLCTGSNQAIDLLDVFGSELADSSARQDCIVCQSEPRDTVVLPCRHMCLCIRCSDYIRTRTQYNSYKCPICRERIGQMMRLEHSGETAVSCSSDDKYEEAAETTTRPVAVAG